MTEARWGVAGLAIALSASVVGAGCLDGFGSDSQEVAGIQLSGAIFTTLEDGTVVNENHYSSKCAVYLNGGPAHPGAAGLPAGDYFFQVTNPSGQVLLSSDSIGQRRFTVDSTGFITGYSGSHDTGIDSKGGITVQLCPYEDTPNPGGVYKVWVTRVEDYSPGKGKHGFRPSRSKTDNFKVTEVAPPPPPPPPHDHDACPPDAPEKGEDDDDGIDFEQDSPRL